MRGEVPGLKPKSDEPPPISITAPPRTDPTRADARLTITLGAADFQDLRLYHNDVPIPSGWDPGAGDRRAEPLSLDVPVTLVSGNNRFYVMASRKDAYDSCSRVVEIDYDGADASAARSTCMALGVKDYQRRSLKYAEDDADQLSEFLHRSGVRRRRANRASRHVLHGADISRKNVERVFDEIARRVEDRPQDTVVVFLAGHTGVFDPQRFCLLLPTYPFSEEEPIQVATRGVAPNSRGERQGRPPIRLALFRHRGEPGPAQGPQSPGDRRRLPGRVDPGRPQGPRDPQVDGALLAAGSDVLPHGRPPGRARAGGRPHCPTDCSPIPSCAACGPSSSAEEPKEVAALALPADADFNRDGIVSTR